MGGACAKKATVEPTDDVEETAAAERATAERAAAEAAAKKTAPAAAKAVQGSLASAAAAALMAAAAAYGVAPGTPEEQGAALAQRGLWSETWDGGASWHASGTPGQPLPPEVADAENGAKAAVEAEDYGDFGTIKPDSEASAQASYGRAVTIEWLVNFTNEHDLWEWTTADVVSKKIKPVLLPRLEPRSCPPALD